MSEEQAAQTAQYTAEDVTAACMALRRAVGREPKKLTTSEFIERLRPDILLTRDQGLDDEEIGAIIERATGRHVTLQEIGHIADHVGGLEPD